MKCKRINFSKDRVLLRSEKGSFPSTFHFLELAATHNLPLLGGSLVHQF